MLLLSLSQHFAAVRRARIAGALAGVACLCTFLIVGDARVFLANRVPHPRALINKNRNDQHARSANKE